jgi:hypothetical protein
MYEASGLGIPRKHTPKSSRDGRLVRDMILNYTFFPSSLPSLSLLSFAFSI